MTKIQKQRDIFNLAFDEMGGLERLLEWARSNNSKGDSNYGDFLKLFVKLAPPIKQDTKDNESHEGFIALIIKEQQLLNKEAGKPVVLLDCKSQVVDT